MAAADHFSLGCPYGPLDNAVVAAVDDVHVPFSVDGNAAWAAKLAQPWPLAAAAGHDLRFPCAWFVTEDAVIRSIGHVDRTVCINVYVARILRRRIADSSVNTPTVVPAVRRNRRLLHIRARYV
jgi:hypothetical protein